MKCPKCGSETGFAKFCPECGEKVPTVVIEELNVPLGKYKGNGDTLTIDPDSLCLEKRPIIKIERTQVLFSDVAAVSYTKAESTFKLGILCIRDRKNPNAPFSTGFNAPSDPYSINFLVAENDIFYSLYLFLKAVAEKNQICDPLPEKASEHQKPQPSKHQIVKDRIKENHAAGIACCPKCGSTSLSANKKGFGAGKALVGMAVTGGLLGAVAGNIGAKKTVVTCLSCGHKWTI